MANQTIIPWKFDEKAKVRFLEELSLTGRRYHSAKAADTTMLTVRAHLDDDPEFAEAYEEALEIYAEAVRLEVRRRGMDGWDEPVYHQGRQGMTPMLDSEGQIVMERIWMAADAVALLPEYARPTGNVDVDGKVEIERPVLVPAVVRKYSDRMLELEAKRVDPGYRDKGTIDMNVKGGILVVPGPTSESVEEWRARANGEKNGRIIDHDDET